MGFKRATKEKAKLRLALMGPTGSGKTYTALALAQSLGKKIALIDSERGSASKYEDLFPPFDTSILESHSPETYVKEIKEAERAGYDVLIIDSLSHAWMGKDGALEQVDRKAKSSQSGNSFTAWRDVTPLHNQLVDAILQSKCHVIATMRTKQEYILEAVERHGKTTMQPRKVGMAPIQRDGVEYEFDVVADMNLDHDLMVSKTRCHQIDGAFVRKPGAEFGEVLRAWLEGGADPKSTDSASHTTAGSESKTNTSAAAAAGSSNPKTATAQAQGAAVADKGSTAGKSPAQSAAVGAAKTEAATSSSSTSAKTPAATGSASASPKPGPPPGKDAKDKSPDTGSTAATQGASAPKTSGGDAKITGGTAQPQKVGKDQMNQLLKAGETNGWSRQQISDFVCHAFKLTPQTLGTAFTWKQWEIAVGVISRKENAGGNVTHSGAGSRLAAENCWRKA